MDLAETVDDLICIFDGSGDTTMDTLAMFVFGWLLAALFVLWLGKLIYNRFLVKAIDKTIDAAAPPPPQTSPVIVDTVDAKKSATAGVSSASATRTGARSSGTTPTTVRRRLTRQSPAPEPKKTKYVPAPTSSGADNVSVLWVNDVFQWLCIRMHIITQLK